MAWKDHNENIFERLASGATFSQLSEKDKREKDFWEAQNGRIGTLQFAAGLTFGLPFASQRGEIAGTKKSGKREEGQRHLKGHPPPPQKKKGA